MMGRHPPAQGKLFYTNVNLDQRIRPNHPLRRISQFIDFDFIYHEVADKYGTNGNVSVPPPVILKLMLLLVFYNVRSERELMATLPERLDWLWFLGYDLDSEMPDHSVLCKARARWGVAVFRCFFERIVWQCVESGLVDGEKIFVDASLIDADAAKHSVVDTHSLRAQLNRRYQELERRLGEPPAHGRQGEVNRRYVSTTDPEAAISRRAGSRLAYQAHRAVDASAEIITATMIAPADRNEAHLLFALADRHQANTHRCAATLVADSKYGTIDNYLSAHDRGVSAHIPDLKKATDKRTQKRQIFPDTRFVYAAESDTYRCPAGETLRRKTLDKRSQRIIYRAAARTCGGCVLRAQCTHNQTGRTVGRHVRQGALDIMREAADTPEARRDLRTRQHLMERSFARGTRYGFDRARWRGCERVEIQECLTASIQNIDVLIRYGHDPRKRPGVAMRQVTAQARNIRTVVARRLAQLNRCAIVASFNPTPSIA
jgi:transposase